MENLTDIEIIESVKKGNISDYALLIDRYKNRAFSLLNKMLKNSMDADEALQDCFMKAYSGIGNFRNDSKFSTWFYKIVYNTAISVINNKKRQTLMQMSSIEDHFDLGVVDDEIYSQSENTKEYLLKIIDRLPVRNALVLILYYIDNLSISEISKILDISLVNTKVILHRSRSALKELLIKHNLQEEVL